MDRYRIRVCRLSGPATGRRGPGLLLWPEIFGINPHIRAVAEQYALDGFVVLAPDVFWRDAPRVELGYEGADREQALGLMRRYEEPLARADITTALQALRARPEVQGRVGSLGYCMGGRLAYLTAATTTWTLRWPTTAVASRTCWPWPVMCVARCNCTTPRSTTASP
jgi:carboxymethylenebutenolidase